MREILDITKRLDVLEHYHGPRCGTCRAGCMIVQLDPPGSIAEPSPRGWPIRWPVGLPPSEFWKQSEGRCPECGRPAVIVKILGPDTNLDDLYEPWPSVEPYQRRAG